MKYFVYALANLVGLMPCFVAGADSPELEVSGFARLVAGVLDDNKAQFIGYDNRVSFGEQSLVAIQFDAKPSEQFSITAQLLAHSAEGRDTGIEWLYASYQPNKSWRFDLGRMRAPIYQYSNVIDVGYAYPWITAPHQVYGTFLFDSFDGFKASYNLSTSSFSADFEAYYGEFEDDVGSVGGVTRAKVRDFHGAVLNLAISDLLLRASYHEGTADIEDQGLKDGFANIIRQAGYHRTADSLSLDGKATAMQLSLEYNKLDYFAKAEWVKINSPILLYPKINGFYVTYGYIFPPFTIHATYANSHFEYDDPVQEIPLGLSPQLDIVALAYQSIINDMPRDNLDSYTLGLRWDFYQGWAFKAEMTHLNGDKNNRSFFDFTDVSFDRTANLYQLALEWVF